MNLPQGFELFAILAVLVLLFGTKKLPDAARSLGRSMRIFKSETKGLRSDDAKPALAQAGTETAAPAAGGTRTEAETEAEREAREFAEWKAARAAERSESR
jgi:sec-independent protein translocase protein TatA